ncbi:hypothetical protein N7492_005719 [Penicillium capsulatum]|uniref:BTB domain-containing protein n=1 Tax=Penicillium capsulatum TaxID=69766 RepID=A0A9W9LRX6_9EURO|nr:hypothetical protein N7492_005719 [Penicillium capsulatum]KAJ6135182.1 hypothetical protein N7512_000342 [Penicillium capsulatum]
MSSKLWESFIQDDVESFQRLLANATAAGPRAAGGTTGAATAAAAKLSAKTGSPGSMIASSPNQPKQKKGHGASPGTSAPDRSSFQRGSTTLSRTDVNARDHYGRTLLHHIASSPKPTASKFAQALLEIPFLDIYAQDWESGWTALHRALYAGNASIALALMARDVRDATDFKTPGHSNYPSGSLIKIKDREAYSPFDVYGATITSRNIKQMSNGVFGTGLDAAGSDAASDMESSVDDDREREDYAADEIFTLGSNKNLNLGLGDQDDRQFPERITLKRPDHLLERFHREYLERMEQLGLADTIQQSHSKELPTLIKYKPLKFQNVVMAKLHTAIITNDPEANLFMCGFGPGGRLGTGDESTQFSFACIETGGLSGKKVTSVALGQDHSMAITDLGEIFSWGSNKFGQLGYSLPRTNNRNDVPIQTTPRQIFNPFKRERIIGAAASSIHSVVFSLGDSGNASCLYTFGKNEGQLGLVDSDARSLKVQTTPRRVGASLFKSQIQMVSAIDRATAVLLQNNEVWVFSQYGYSKLSFPLEGTSQFIKDSFMATRYDAVVNRIVKLACGGNTICALSSSGDVFTVQVNQSENLSVSTSTTNPAKIRNSLATPARAWSVKRSHMAARDVDVGQDGSIIICTTSGSAWRKERRTKNKAGAAKEFKFARIPGLSRAVAVRSNAFGAYAVAQLDCDVTKEQIHVESSTLWDDIMPLSPFMTPGPDDVDDAVSSDLMDGSTFFSSATLIKRAILRSADMESEFLSFRSKGMVWITSSLSDLRIPAHQFILAGRSPVLRKALQEFRESYYASIPDVLDIEYDKDGQVQIRLEGIDFLTVMNLVFFLYTDGILDVWHKIRSSSDNSSRYRQVRTEVMRVATVLGLPALERAARLMVEPQRSLKFDMAHAIHHSSFFDDADVVVQLNGDTVKVHSQVICQRCPFFDALFNGRSGGRWLQMRLSDPAEMIPIDLKHIERSTFDFVLRYMYADAEDDLFDQVRTKSLDDLIDVLLDVMYVADELMIDRLSQICQKMLGRFVNPRNISYLLNSVGPVYIDAFKKAALEYICLDLEGLLANRYLDDLDKVLLHDLDAVCHDNQLSCFPISRGRNSEEYILEKYPEIVACLEADKERRIDSMVLQNRIGPEGPNDMRPRQASEKTNQSLSIRKGKSGKPKDGPSSVNSPMLKSRQSAGDLMFEMDEEPLFADTDKGKTAMHGMKLGESDSYPESPALGASNPKAGSLGERSFLDQQMSSLPDAIISESPTESRAIALHQKRAMVTSPSSSAPWGSPGIPSGRKDLKDIMGEASQSRVSNLTLGMAGRGESSGNFTPKISQKDRKKMQQQQMQDKLAAQQKAKDEPRNPWQLPPPVTPSTPNQNQRTGQAGPSTPGSEAKKPAQRPAMTLRQTVAGNHPPQPKPINTPIQTQSRSVSANMSDFPPFSKDSPSGPSKSPQPYLPKASPQPSIQSIRHIPRPGTQARSPSQGSLSLANILHQQQTEKDEIREAASAKHNLQEIQAEQEFQQWWDQESKRVQGLLDTEPEPHDQGSKTARGGKTPNSTGSSRKRRGNKATPPGGNGTEPTQAGSTNGNTTPRKKATDQPPTHSPANAPGSQGRAGSNRGARRGERGKGKDRT